MFLNFVFSRLCNCLNNSKEVEGTRMRYGFGPQELVYHASYITSSKSGIYIASRVGSLYYMLIGFTRSSQQFLASVMLAVPVSAQVSSLVFQKAMRLKDIKGAEESAGEAKKPDATESKVTATENAKTPEAVIEEATIEAELEAATEAAELDPLLGEENGDLDAAKHSTKTSSKTAGKKGEKKEEAPARSQRATINLMSVDASRVSDFCSFQHLFLVIAVSFTIATYGLVRLIGWASLGAGWLGLLVVAPMNIFVTRGYARCNAQLMKERDQKVTAVTEALQGVRQIKFSAAESRWQDKIMGVRDKELGQLRKVFYYTIALRFFFVLSPIMLSMCALCSYAWINGDLPAR